VNQVGSTRIPYFAQWAHSVTEQRFIRDVFEKLKGCTILERLDNLGA
jgi:hypothetical protein